jgi:hypothetical protein
MSFANPKLKEAYQLKKILSKSLDPIVYEYMYIFPLTSFSLKIINTLPLPILPLFPPFAYLNFLSPDSFFLFKILHEKMQLKKTKRWKDERKMESKR